MFRIQNFIICIRIPIGEKTRIRILVKLRLDPDPRVKTYKINVKNYFQQIFHFILKSWYIKELFYPKAFSW